MPRRSKAHSEPENIFRDVMVSMCLYRIKESEVQEVIYSPDKEEAKDNKKIAYKTFLNKFSGLPLKVVYIVEDDIVIITVYPLKKSYL